MKFQDKGFIYKYKDFVKVQIFNAGLAVLDMKIYEDKICKSTFECQDLDSFNKENLGKNYKTSFLKDLFEENKKESLFEDKENKILIKIRRD